MSPIVWELGLVIVCVVGFAAWQFTTLKRDMRITQEEKRRREAQEAAAAPGADASPPAPGTPIAPPADAARSKAARRPERGEAP